MDEHSNLWDHQRLAVERICDAKSFLLMFPPGTGKTRTALEALSRLGLAETFIFCPKLLCEEWVDQMRIGGFRELHDSTTILKGEIAKRINILKENSNPRIWITNYEALTNKAFVSAVMSRAPRNLVFDESQRLKNWRAARTKAAQQIVKHSNGMKLLLTGTPMPNDLRDLWSQFQLLRKPCKEIPDNVHVFTARYMFDKNFRRAGHPGYFPDYQPRPGAIEQITEAIWPWAMSVKLEDVLPSLPPLITKTIKLDMLPKQAKHYSELKKDLITTIKETDSTCVVKNAGIKVLRLMQVTNGILETDIGTQSIDTPKDDALRELLEDLIPSMKVIIWTCWRGTYERIKKIGDGFADTRLVVGGMAEKDQVDNVQAFKSDNRTRILVMHPACGSLGLNLQVAGCSIYYSKSFNSEYEEQSRARARRAGSERYHRSLLRFDLECRDSVDEHITSSLREKKSLQDYIMGYRDGII